MKTLMLIIATLWVTQTLADFRVTDPVFSPPHWTTATRPVCTAGGGCVGYNTDLDKLETWNGTAWVISGSGSSDILGPVASATNTVAIYGDGTGKLLSSTLYTIPTDPGNVGDVLRISSAGTAGTGTTVVLSPQVDGSVQSDVTRLWDWGSRFAVVLPGDIVTISSGTIGDYTVVSVLSANELQLSGAIATGTFSAGIGYSINRGGAGSGTPGVAEWQAISSSKIVDADGNTSVDTDVTGTGNADTIIFSNNGIETARFVPGTAGTAGTPTAIHSSTADSGVVGLNPNTLYEPMDYAALGILVGDTVTLSGNLPDVSTGTYTVTSVAAYGELVLDAPFYTGTGTVTSIPYAVTRAATGTSGSEGRLGIGTDTPNPNAILDLSSDSKAFLLPRLTNAAMNAIPSPLNGMQVYNVDQKKVYFYNGSGWEPTGVASALFNLGITDASSIATPTNPPAPPTGYKNGDFYIVNGFGSVAPQFFPSVTTAGTGDYLIFDDGGDGIGGAAADTWEKIAFSDVGQITRNGTTTDGNLMIWDQDNTNSAKDLGISALDLLTMGLNAPGPNFAVVSAGAGDKTTKLTPYTLPQDTGGYGYILASDGAGTTTWVDIGTISGSGNVVGPASATDGSLAVYDGTTGKLITSTPYTMPLAACADGEILSSDGTNFVCTPVGAVSKTVYNANGYASVAGAGTPTETPVIASGTGATSATTTQLVDNTSPFSVVLPGDIVTISSSTIPGDYTVTSVVGANTLQLDGAIASNTFEQDIAYSINRISAGAGTSTSGFYFSNVRVPTNSTCYTVTNNSTEGFYFTVNEKCVFTVSFTGSNISGLLDAGFVLNPTAGEAAGSFKDIPFGKKLCNTAVQGVTGSTGSCSFQWEGTVGEKIQLIGSAGMTPDTPEKFAVSILGFSPGSDIGVSTAAVTPPTEVVVVSQRSTGGASASARMVLFDNSSPFASVLVGDTVKITAPAGGGSETTIVAQNGGGISGSEVGGNNYLVDYQNLFGSLIVGDIVRISSCTNCNIGDHVITTPYNASTLIVNDAIYNPPAAGTPVLGLTTSFASDAYINGVGLFYAVLPGDIVDISSGTMPGKYTVVSSTGDQLFMGSQVADMAGEDIGYTISREATSTSESVILGQRGGGVAGPIVGGSNILVEDSADIMSAIPGDIVRITACTNCNIGDFTILSTDLPTTLTVSGNIYTGSGTATNTIVADGFNGATQGSATELWDNNNPFSAVLVGDVVQISSSTVGPVQATVTTVFDGGHIAVSAPIGGTFEAGIGYSIFRSGQGSNDITYSIVRAAATGTGTDDIVYSIVRAASGTSDITGGDYLVDAATASSLTLDAPFYTGTGTVANITYEVTRMVEGSGGGGTGDVVGPASSVLNTIAQFADTTGKLLKQTPYALPTAVGTNGQVLQSNGTNLVFATPAAGSGTGGDVVGPASAVDSHIAIFDGTTGKLLKDTGISTGGGEIALSPGAQLYMQTNGGNYGHMGANRLQLADDSSGYVVLKSPSAVSIGSYGIAFPAGHGTVGQTLSVASIGTDAYDFTTPVMNLQWAAPGASTATGGSGDVVGPASSFDKGVAFFDGTTGKLLGGQFGIGSATPFDSLTVGLNFDGSGGGQTPVLRMVNPNSNILSVKQSTGQNVNYEIIYPSTAPGANQVLETSDGTGQLYWIATPASDARLKKNISPMSRDFLADIMALTPSSFEWTEKIRPVGVQLGLIAQDVMKVIPEAVYAKPSGTLDLNDRALIATLIGAMKQQQAQIEELKLEVEKLKK